MLVRYSVALLVAGTFWASAARLSAETPSAATEPARQVEFFEAKKAGDIEVTFVAKNDHEATVTIKNVAKQPLAIKLPEAFAGAPVLAQQPANNNRQNRQNNNNGGGQNQGAGGGLGQQGGGGGGGGGFLNLAPERQIKLKADCVCLDHLKKNPNASIKYEIMPISQYTSQPGVAEVCAALGRGELDRRVAQAAAWHLNNGVSWEDLAHKELKHLNGTRESYFTPEEIQAAIKVSTAAVEHAKKALPSAGDESAKSASATTTATAGK